MPTTFKTHGKMNGFNEYFIKINKKMLSHGKSVRINRPVLEPAEDVEAPLERLAHGHQERL